MNVLFMSSEFPNEMQPTRGAYNRQIVLALSKLCRVTVVSPIPWVPPIIFRGAKRKLRSIPLQERIDNVDVYHPRYIVIPKIGRLFNGVSFFVCLIKGIKIIFNKLSFNIMFIAGAYPDGVGGLLIAKMINVPVLIQAIGSDINIDAKHFIKRKMIKFALERCDKVITVSTELKNEIINMGIDADKIDVVVNGVDTSLFEPLDKKRCRKMLNIPINKKVILFAGNLVHTKGVIFLLEAFVKVVNTVSEAVLFVIGDGPLRHRMEKIAKEEFEEGSVQFVGCVDHNKMPIWLNACDVFCLPSIDEGCPNVILEAIASETPIIASKVGGIPELINLYGGGVLVDPGNSNKLIEAIEEILNNKKMQADHLRSKNKINSWIEVVNNLYDKMKSILNKAKVK